MENGENLRRTRPETRAKNENLGKLWKRYYDRDLRTDELLEETAKLFYEANKNVLDTMPLDPNITISCLV